MEYNNLDKNINQILKNEYIIPLYQRNYAWGEPEISQLVQDIYENFTNNPTGNYYIGSLVVLKRANNDFEVIDGQQRLTTLSLIAKYLNKSLTIPKLKYDSRPEVEHFLNSYYQHGTVINNTVNHKISHFIEAIDHIINVNITPREIQKKTLNDIENLEFVNYFFNNVIIIKVEIPNDTDVAHYFEVMNNRGEQLHEHEIIKARLLEKEKESEYFQIFAKIWDACSQMNQPIQKMFTPVERQALFGPHYNTFHFNLSELKNKTNSEIEPQTINEILSKGNIVVATENIDHSEDDAIESIIDFPNFLMHIFKLKYDTVLYEGVPLNGDDLLNVFHKLESSIDSTDFLKNLLFYRLVFDRFVVKSFDDEQTGESYKWSLIKPEMYYYDKKKQSRLIFKNTFDKQERIIKALSMLQVTFRTKKYKNWLQEVLSWFTTNESLAIQSLEFQNKLDHLILETFDKNSKLASIINHKNYAEGTNTPHFLLNFIDYLLWVETPSSHNFEFKYRNSVEHHLPQSMAKEKTEYKDVIDNLGNLCLVGKGLNSKMNNESPVGKASATSGKYYRKDLPPKQKLMYDLTNKQGDWGVLEIKSHYSDIIELLKSKNEILN